MHPRFSLLALLFAVAALGLAACGDDDDSDGGGAATNGGTANGGETATEAEGQTGGGNAPAPSGDAVRSAKVEIVDFAYEPDPVTIEEGGKVIWMNRDEEPHTATAKDGSFDTEMIEPDKLKSENFKEPGTYPYFCEVHPSMKGTVEVVAAG
jgi:plastocyanin